MAKTYGEWLKEAREAKGWSQQVLANRAFMSRSMIAAIEQGVRYPTEHDAQALDAALGTGNVLTTFRPGREREKGVADYFQHAMALERQAVMIREFAPLFVPGILQTEGYATATVASDYPRRSDEERHNVVVSRLERAKLLEDPVTPGLWALLDESVIRRPIGGPAVMAAQLHHIANLAESGRIRVHVIPFGPLPMEGLVSLMWFADQPPVAYAEGARTGRVHDSPAMVELMLGAYDQALSEALSLDQSTALIRATAEEYDKHG